MAPVEPTSPKAGYAFTALAVLFCLLVISSRPELRHIMDQVPGRRSGDWEHVWTWYGFLAFIWLVGTSSIKLVAPTKPCPKVAGWTIGPAMMAGGFVLLYMQRPMVTEVEMPYPTQPIRMVPYLLIAAGGLALPVFRGAFPARGNKLVEVLARCGIVTVLLVVPAVFLWFLAEYRTWLFTHRAVTVWLFYAVLVAIVCTGRVVDYLASLGVTHRKLLLGTAAGLVGMSATFLSYRSPVGSGVANRELSEEGKEEEAYALTTAWTTAFEQRVKGLPKGTPLIIVASSGGGSRAAIYSSLVLEALKEITVQGPVVDEDGTERVGRWTAADHVVLISSVSGGSLAAARFAFPADSPDGAAEQEFTWRHTRRGDVVGRMARLVDGQRDQVTEDWEEARKKLKDKDDLGSWLQVYWQERFDRLDHRKKAIAALDRADFSFPLQAEVEARTWPGTDVSVRVETGSDPFRSRFVDEMCADYMAPLLVGFLSPWMDRGRALSGAWERSFGWEEVDPAATAEDAPLLFFNTTRAGRGNRVVVGIPPIAPPMFARTGHVQSMSRLHPGARVRTAEAVRLSANFPWGLPTAVVAEEGTSILDGGMLDNTGLFTLARFALALQVAVENPKGESTRSELELASFARYLRSELRSRGVILLEIDASMQYLGAGGEEPFTTLGGAGAIRELVWRNNQVQTVRRVVRRSLGLDTNLFRDNLYADNFPDLLDNDPLRDYFLHVRMVCNERSNVMTSWALGPTDKARVLFRFLQEKEWMKEQIAAAFDPVPFVIQEIVEDREVTGLQVAVLDEDAPEASVLARTLVIRNGGGQDEQEKVTRIPLLPPGDKLPGAPVVGEMVDGRHVIRVDYR